MSEEIKKNNKCLNSKCGKYTTNECGLTNCDSYSLIDIIKCKLYQPEPENNCDNCGSTDESECDTCKRNPQLQEDHWKPKKKEYLLIKIPIENPHKVELKIDRIFHLNTNGINGLITEPMDGLTVEKIEVEE